MKNSVFFPFYDQNTAENPVFLREPAGKFHQDVRRNHDLNLSSIIYLLFVHAAFKGINDHISIDLVSEIIGVIQSVPGK